MNKAIFGLKKTLFACKENNFQPKIFKPHFLLSLVFAALILKAAVLPFYALFPRSVFFAEIISNDIIDLLNVQRKSAGLLPLKESVFLDQAAFLKAQDMIDNDYFAHVSPGGTTPWYWLDRVGYQYSLAGENLAIGFLDSMEVHQAWNSSSSHRRNLLDERFEEIGVAVLRGPFEGRETTVVVQFFGSPAKSVKNAAVLPEKEMPLNPSSAVAGETQFSEILPEPSLAQPAVEPAEDGLGIVFRPQESDFNAFNEEPENVQGPANVFAASPESAESQKKIWAFLTQNYSILLKTTIIFAATFIFIIMIANLGLIARAPLSRSKKWLVFRKIASETLLVVLILFSLAMADKLLIIQLIPHRLKI